MTGKKIEITAFDLAKRLIKVKEIPGSGDNPFILWCLSLCHLSGSLHDEISWCSAFVNEIAFRLGLPRSESAAARSWLKVGTPVSLEDAEPGNDVVILKRGTGNQPGPEVINAPGHVGFFGGIAGQYVIVLGGNQHDSVNVSKFPVANILGVRRLTPDAE